MFKKTVYAIFLVSSLVVSNIGYANTNCSSRKIGSTEYINCNDGSSGQSRSIGSTEYSDFTDMHGNSTNCTTRRIGSTTYTDCH